MQFSFQGNIKDIQNKLIAQSIKEVSNLQLLKSEEAIRAVIKSYTDRFRAAEGRLTQAIQYVAKSREIIKTRQFNNLFESLYIDLSGLYSDLEAVDNVLSLNLFRNKNYLTVIKKRINDLWLRLNLTRLNTYDSSPSSESYYESFSTHFGLVKQNNITVDRKFGFAYIVPTFKTTHNESIEIKSITSTTYPAHNEDGGVNQTTNILNTFSENYGNGSRDMLRNGLWKEEVITADIPDMIVNIGDIDNPFYKSYRGVVSIVDIKFSSAVNINRFDFDLFGEMITRIDQILYKPTTESPWSVATFELEDDSTEAFSDVVRGSSFDVINFLNIVPIKAKELRIVFLKDNYSIINSKILSNASINTQIYEDFSERRYELLRFGTSIDDHLSAPANEENISLYSQIMNIIESTRDLDRMLQKINQLLNPQPLISMVDFNRLLKYEVGAWSIEPIEEVYSNIAGGFQSNEYYLTDKSLLSVSLMARQNIPKSSTSNWYINLGKQTVPIIENALVWRKEPANFIDLSTVGNFGDFPGLFILLDFPVDATLASALSFYYEGQILENILSNIIFLNSRLLYIDDLTFENTNIVIRYPVDLYKCVNVYVLSSDIPDYHTCGIVASRRNALQMLLNNAPSLNGKYVIDSTIASKDETAAWFGQNYDQTIFADSSLGILTELSISTPNAYIKLKPGVLEGVSKLQCTYSDVQNFLSSGISAFDYTITNTDRGIVQMILKRKL